MAVETWRELIDDQAYIHNTNMLLNNRLKDGKRKYGDRFVGEPLDHLREELIDALYYTEAARVQRLYGDQLTSLQYENWKIAEDNGWHDKGRSFGDEVSLIHSEVSESLEEYRKSGKVDDAVAEELADIVIRVMDTAETHSVNLYEEILKKMVANRSRPYRHGDKHL